MANKKKKESKQSKQEETGPEMQVDQKKEKPVFQKGKKSAGIFMPDLNSEKVIGEIKKLHVLTPYIIASKFNIRLSLAKVLLKELERKNIIQKTYGDHKIKIYAGITKK